MRTLPACLLILFSGITLADWPGLPTRDQNPLLQGYLIPAQPLPAKQGWSTGAALFITNTYQTDQSGDQQLLIDVENTRLDLQLNYSAMDWMFSANLPLIDNRPGQLDRLIYEWHEFFGLPQGGRRIDTLDQIHLYWKTNGNEVVSIQQPASGIGDLLLAAGRNLGSYGELWFSIELPTGNNALFSNDGADLALWWRRQGDDRHTLQGYGSLGLVKIHDGGLHEGYLKPGLMFAQAGLRYRWKRSAEALVQADWHNTLVEGNALDALDDSLQAQFGLSFPHFIDGYRLDIFFSEDIWPGHAPDITFGVSLLSNR